MTGMKMDIDALRKDFPFVSSLCYLDSASVSPSPQPAVDVMKDYYTHQPFNFGVGVSRAASEVISLVNQARERLATFICARSASEIIFTKNTTEAINLVASGIQWKPGNEIIISCLEHQSNVIPWMRLAEERGIRLTVLPVGPERVLDTEVVEQHLSENTRLLAVTHVSNVFGSIQPVAEIGALARSRDILFLVDAAQSAGRVPIDVNEIQCDFIAFCGRKSLLGPQGTGFLYSKEVHMEHLRPLVVGSRAGNVIDENSFEFVAGPHKFEAGVLNTGGVLGLAAAVEYIEDIGLSAIQSRLKTLSKLLVSELQMIPELDLYGAAELDVQAGIVAWNLLEMDPNQVARELDQMANIIVASGGQGSRLAMRHLGVEEIVRSSVHFYNSEEEIHKLIKAIKDLVQRHKSKVVLSNNVDLDNISN
ncbi:MAG: cysteine desulfurase [Anaerolineales bacterium]|jgi:cysteine desulfurase/selenocysteine lyase|nr:cysteine desulfurase [Anaerolineales bacterium]|tara:strand:- start:2805 stop:4067 length:1263 start_codon:yes stop_codon:yes gene_type:complete